MYVKIFYVIDCRLADFLNKELIYTTLDNRC